MPSWCDLGFGVGLRSDHYDEIAGAPPPVEWFEALTDNYLDTGGRPLAILERVRRDRPVALHGVGLSIGSTDPLDPTYLRQLRALAARIQPALITDHLCWTGVGGRSTFDLLPLPYTEEALDHVVERVRRVQDHLGARIALENPSTYVGWKASTIPEAEFLAVVAERADCGILLDVNNVYVSARNLDWSADAYVDAIPTDRIAQIHLAGFTDMGTYLFDTHGAPVHPDVWLLYDRVIARCRRPVSTLVEWDADIPSLDRVWAEAEAARRRSEATLARVHVADCQEAARVDAA